MRYTNSHLEDWIENLYRKIDITEPEINFERIAESLDIRLSFKPVTSFALKHSGIYNICLDSRKSRYELGSREPDYKTLINISNILDVSLDYLLKGESNEKEFQDEAKKVLNDPETFLVAKEGEVTDEILQAALEIITEQLKERRKSDK